MLFGLVCYILLLFITPTLSGDYVLIWYDDMGKDRGDWAITGSGNIAYEGSGNCQTNLCARIKANPDNNFNYMNRETNVSEYSSLQLTLYIKAVDLEQADNDRCEIWYKYGNGEWLMPVNGDYPDGTNGVYTVNITSSSEPLIHISLEINADRAGDECYFDNVYLYGVPITNNPTPSPTNNPTPAPTDIPSPTPTQSPTNNPTPSPTDIPSPAPTNNPTNNPTPAPTDIPSPAPTQSPTNNPTPSPTDIPSPAPTNNPTSMTKAPSVGPTPSPTSMPTPAPTINPTSSPTWTPSKAPTNTVLVIPNNNNKPTNTVLVDETTKSAESNNGNNNGNKSSEQNGSNGFLPNWYYVVIIGPMLIIFCVAMFLWLYCIKKKRSKQGHHSSVDMNVKKEQGNITNIEIERVYSVSNASPITRTVEVDENYNLFLTPIGPSPITPPLPTENDDGEDNNDDDDDDDNGLYLTGTVTKQTPNEDEDEDEDDENEEEDGELYVNVDNVENEDNVTTTGK